MTELLRPLNWETICVGDLIISIDEPLDVFYEEIVIEKNGELEIITFSLTTERERPYSRTKMEDTFNPPPYREGQDPDHTVEYHSIDGRVWRKAQGKKNFIQVSNESS